jgi:hypothetical protein
MKISAPHMITENFPRTRLAKRHAEMLEIAEKDAGAIMDRTIAV